MPTYSYKCGCGHTTEVFESMKASPIQPCPQCVEEGCDGTMERQIGGGAGVIWKTSKPTPIFHKKSK